MRCVASFVLLLASGTAYAAVGVPVAFATLAKGAVSGVAGPAQIVVRNPVDWASLWARHTRFLTAPPPLPAVDFSADMVVALYLGERPSGGYGVEITRIERTDAGLSIRYRATKPYPGAMQTQALTHPFHMVKLPRADDPVTFILETPAS